MVRGDRWGWRVNAKEDGSEGSERAVTVSVILPTRNRARMLKRAVTSVLAQTYTDFELIIVSDGSSDETEAVVAGFGDQRLRFLKHAKARGASAARNTGLKVTHGKYIAFIDDDDEWTSNKLELQLPLLQASPSNVGLVYSWMDYLQDGRVYSTRKPVLRGSVLSKILDRQGVGTCATLMVKREVLDVVGGFDESLPRGNDGDFIRRVARHFQVDYVPEVLCHVHTGHHDRISVNNRRNLLNAVKAEEKRLVLFRDEFEEHSEAFSNVLFTIAKRYMLIGMWKPGLQYAYRAWRKNPRNRRLYLGIPRAMVVGVMQRLRSSASEF